MSRSSSSQSNMSASFMYANSLRDDGDDMMSRQLENRSIFNHVLNVGLSRFNNVDVEFLSRNTNMNAWDGYGSCDSRFIDTESHLRLDSSVTQTRSRANTTISEKREFVANPHVATASAFMPPTDSSVSHQPTIPAFAGDRISFDLVNNRCEKGKSAETSFERFTRTPLIPTMQAFVENDVPDVGFIAIGQPSNRLV